VIVVLKWQTRIVRQPPSNACSVSYSSRLLYPTTTDTDFVKTIQYLSENKYAYAYDDETAVFLFPTVMPICPRVVLVSSLALVHNDEGLV